MASQAETLTEPTDYVYHLTDYSKVNDILERGLTPNPERGQDEIWQKMEHFLDSQRPDDIKQKGISRLNGVYAYPDIGWIRPKYIPQSMVGLDPAARKTETAFAIDVDPGQAMVFDMMRADHLFSAVGAQYGQDKPSDEMIQRAEAYWKSGISLSSFRECYEKEYGEFGIIGYKLRKGLSAPEGLNPHFTMPEVIVPGPVDPAITHWMASGADYTE